MIAIKSFKYLIYQWCIDTLFDKLNRNLTVEKFTVYTNKEICEGMRFKRCSSKSGHLVFYDVEILTRSKNNLQWIHCRRNPDAPIFTTALVDGAEGWEFYL